MIENIHVTLALHITSANSPLHYSPWCLAFMHWTKNNQDRFSPVSPTGLLGFLFSPSSRVVWLHAWKPWLASLHPSMRVKVTWASFTLMIAFSEFAMTGLTLGWGRRNPAHYKQSPQPDTYFQHAEKGEDPTPATGVHVSPPQDDASFLASHDTATHIRNIHTALQGLNKTAVVLPQIKGWQQRRFLCSLTTTEWRGFK